MEKKKMLRIVIVYLITAMTSCSFADAKSRPASTNATKPLPKPDVIPPEEVASSLVAWNEKEAAAATLRAKQASWDLVKSKLSQRYGINVDAGEGWDQINGQYKIRRQSATPRSPEKKGPTQ